MKNENASIYFNRVVQGVYEMGSTFKIFSVGLIRKVDESILSLIRNHLK